MVVIGITGGFLTGKSSVAGIFGEKGCTVLNIDEMYHEKVLTNNTVKKELMELFGPDILVNSEIDRYKMRKRVFNNRHGLENLERITHPLIIEELKKNIDLCKEENKPVVAEVPLLYEKKLSYLFDKVVVVNADFKTQLQRAEKLGYSREEANLFISKQILLKDKVKLADFVINNNGRLKEVRKEVEVIIGDINKGVC